MADYAKTIKDGMNKKKSFRSTDDKVDPAFLRDMGYLNKKKKKGK